MILLFKNVRLGWSWAVAHWRFSPRLIWPTSTLTPARSNSLSASSNSPLASVSVATVSVMLCVSTWNLSTAPGLLVPSLSLLPRRVSNSLVSITSSLRHRTKKLFPRTSRRFLRVEWRFCSLITIPGIKAQYAYGWASRATDRLSSPRDYVREWRVQGHN